MTWCFLILMIIHRAGGSPYPNVRLNNGCRNSWRAEWSCNGRKIRLGSFASPQAARQAVLISKAGHLEHKADIYRDRAARYRTVNNAAAAQQDDAQAEKLETKAARFRTEADWLGERVAP